MTAAQKTAKANFKKAIEYRKKTGVSLKEAFAHVYGKKVGAAPKKKAAKKAAPKKAAKKIVKKSAPKKAAKKKHTKYGKVKAHTRRVAGTHKDTKSHNVNIRVLSGTNKIPSEFVSLSGYKETKEIVLGSVGKLKSIEKLIPEVKVRITRGKSVINDQIRSSKDSATIFKKFIGKDKIQTQEFFAVMYLSQSNKVIGVYVHSMGSINATSADVRLILGGALRVGAVSLIICHNHPSGNMQPSEADIQLTKKLIAAAKYHDIRVLDHIIIGKDNQFSFADNNLL